MDGKDATARRGHSIVLSNFRAGPSDSSVGGGPWILFAVISKHFFKIKGATL
jgi:hypothetical protein